MRRWIVLACLAASVFWGSGRILGERGLIASLLFYLPALLVVLGLLLVAFLLRRRKPLAFGVLALALLPAVIVVEDQNGSAPAAAAPGAGQTLSLLHWNVCRGYTGWPRIAAKIAEDPPQLAILSEVMTVADSEELGKLLPQLPFRQYGTPMLVLSQYPLDPIRLVHNGDGLRLYELLLRQENETWRFFALDMNGSPEVPREPAMKVLAEKIRSRQPDFLAGDFNTPRGSRLLSPLSPGYRHGYEMAGSGWSYTWPTLLPMMSIDHLFIKEAAVALDHYEIGSSVWSDHRFQRATLRRLSTP